MIDRILKLMQEKNVNAARLTDELEISKSAITDWKKGKGKPSADTIVKLAEYFDVTTDFLLIGISGNERLTENELEIIKLLNKFDERNQIKLIGKVEEISKEMEKDIEKVKSNKSKQAM